MSESLTTNRPAHPQRAPQRRTPLSPVPLPLLAARAALVAIAYGALAWYALALPVREDFLSPIWLASGVALAAVLVWGPLVVIGLLVADVVVSMHLLGFSFVHSLGFGITDSLEPLVALWLVRRFSVHVSLSRIRDVLGLLAATVASTLVSSTGGALLLVASPQLTMADFGSLYTTYFTSVVMGNVLITPFALSWISTWRRPRSLVRVAECAVIVTLIVALCAVVFSQPHWHLLYLFLLFPTFTWASLRFGVRGASGSTLVVAVLALWGTVHDEVLIFGLSAVQTSQVLQVMFGAIVITNLLLAATISERNVALRDKHDMADTLLNAQAIAHVGSWEWCEPSGMTWSPELFRLLGEDEGDGHAVDVDRLITRVHADDRQRVEVALRAALHDGETFDLEHRVMVSPADSADASDDERAAVRIVQHSGRLIVGDGRPLRVIGTLLDITERKAAEQLKDAIITTASHELRTPLTSIVGFASTLMSAWDSLSDTDRLHFISIIEEQGLRLSDLVDDTLMQSRVDAGSIEAIPEPFLVRRAIDNALTVADGIDVEIACDDALAATATMRHVERVLVNLVTNAAKYGARPIRIEARREAARGVRGAGSGAGSGAGATCIRVIDHGPGVNPSFVPHLFERFTRGPNVDAFPGTGLGLSICTGLIEANDGTLTYRRDEAAGASIFEVYLPGARS